MKLYSVANIADNNTLVIQDSLDKLCLWSDLWQLTVLYKMFSNVDRQAAETWTSFWVSG